LFYILFGADAFSLQERLTELKRGWGDEESLAINTTIFDVRQLTLNQLKSACDSAPFLGQYRLVIVEGLLSHFEQRGRRLAARPDSGDAWQTLSDYVPSMPSTTILVLVDGKIARNNRLLRKLAPKGIAQEFPPLRGTKLQQWIQSRVAENGGSISPPAVRLLAELAGENLWGLANEIEKLHLYTGGKRRIEESDVQQITSYAREANVFAMVDAIVERRSPAAVQLLHQLLAEGLAPPYLLFMITRQVRLMVQTKALGARRLSAMEMQNRLGLSSNYPIDRLLRQTAGYPVERLVEIYRRLLETDIAIKTGKWKDELALDLLVAELCHVA
jgi:DNA polymerase-3 subunit delta